MGGPARRGRGPGPGSRGRRLMGCPDDRVGSAADVVRLGAVPRAAAAGLVVATGPT
ncbi:hypothetical protein ACFPM0_23115 [Pseudonocardia sulfidoxydans]|uniref:hypothetical protein n=1 Tax=Pseudonocardia sulfidoxydans TaxID=54011 RepID=UPI00360AD95B